MIHDHGAYLRVEVVRDDGAREVELDEVLARAHRQTALVAGLDLRMLEHMQHNVLARGVDTDQHLVLEIEAWRLDRDRPRHGESGSESDLDIEAVTAVQHSRSTRPQQTHEPRNTTTRDGEYRVSFERRRPISIERDRSRAARVSVMSMM